jgi:transcriptional regulator with XRE-family HTH domain
MKRKNIVGENIRRLRQEAGLTQDVLAAKSGLSQGYINQLEIGKRRYTQKSLEIIAEALSVPVIEFFIKERQEEAPVVAEKAERYASKGIKKHKKKDYEKEFLRLLKGLPEHVVEHYLTLLRLESEMWKDS